MLEFEIQNRFIEHITGRREIKRPEDNPLEIYRELVYLRFKETLANTLPIFTKEMGEQRMQELTEGFIADKPESPYIWQAPGDFIRYIEKRELLGKEHWGYDLLWYEWIEVDLFMKTPPESAEEEIFQWEKSWRISRSARTRFLRYRVYLKEFTNPGSYPIILYYNYSETAVHYQEITPFLYDFFTAKGKTATDALKAACTKHQLDEHLEELQELLTPTLQEYVRKKVLEAV